jgi:hypothetical protein
MAIVRRIGAHPLVYFAALIESYRAGDMGQVYPIARGSAAQPKTPAEEAAQKRVTYVG